MVRPKKKPGDIISSMMNGEEQRDMIDFLCAYQKSDVGWDIFRNKMPHDLLAKWGRVMTECFENGFINPVGDRGNGKIVWSQILSDNTNESTCTLCQQDPCMGREDAKRQFIPCGRK